LRCVGKTFNSKEGEGSLEGGVKFIGYTCGEIGGPIHSTFDNLIKVKVFKL